MNLCILHIETAKEHTICKFSIFNRRHWERARMQCARQLCLADEFR